MTALQPYPSASGKYPLIEVLAAIGQNWNATSPTWTDLTPYVRFGDGVSWSRGRGDEFGQIEPGNFSLTVGNDAPHSSITAATPLMITAYWPTSATGYVQFVGHIEDRDVQTTVNETVVQLSGMEYLGMLGYANITRVLNTAATAPARLASFMSLAGVPVSRYSFATGRWPVGISDTRDQSVLSACQEVVDSQVQILYQDRGGTIRSTNVPFTSSSGGTFGTAVGTYPYVDIGGAQSSAYVYSLLKVTSEVSYGGTGGGGTQYPAGTVTMAVSATPESRYGSRMYERTFPPMSLTNLTAAATMLATFLGNGAAYRVKTVTLRPAAAPTTLWPVVLAADIGSKFTFQVPTSTDAYVQSVSHSISGGDWTVSWQTSPN